MKRYIIMLLLILTAVPCIAMSAEVKNVKVSQIGNNAVATYDLVGGQGEQDAEVTVAITIGNDNKTSDQLHLTGDFGKKVKVGKGKKIVWNATKDLPPDFDGDLSWEVKAVVDLAGLDKRIADMKARLTSGKPLPGDSLDALTAMMEQKEQAETNKTEKIRDDLAKYRKIAQGKYGQDMKGAAWAALVAAHPAAKGVIQGDEEGFRKALGMGRFSLQGGVIEDEQLGLQWAPANGQAMNYDQAQEYARNLSLAGGGWRLPTRAELKSLYDPSKPGHMDPVFNIDRDWVWTSELIAKYSSGAWFVNFVNGAEGSLSRDFSDGDGLVLAVRSRR